MKSYSDRRAVTRRGLVIALGVAVLAASGIGGTAFAQERGRSQDRDRTQECDLMQDDCLQRQLQARDRERLRQCDPARQDCQTLRHELRVKVEEQWRRGQGAGKR
ncbi:MAG: hypothetical protein HKM95_11590 [Inquilinus sp.]|nr:hypothetical protein [Inquilinus sp.]